MLTLRVAFPKLGIHMLSQNGCFTSDATPDEYETDKSDGFWWK